MHSRLGVCRYCIHSYTGTCATSTQPVCGHNTAIQSCYFARITGAGKERGVRTDLLGKKRLQLSQGVQGPTASVAFVHFFCNLLVMLQVQRQSFHSLQLCHIVGLTLLHLAAGEVGIFLLLSLQAHCYVQACVHSRLPAWVAPGSMHTHHSCSPSRSVLHEQPSEYLCMCWSELMLAMTTVIAQATFFWLDMGVCSQLCMHSLYHDEAKVNALACSAELSPDSRLPHTTCATVPTSEFMKADCLSVLM